MPRAPLRSQGEPEVHHEGRAGQGDKQAEAGEEDPVVACPFDQEIDVLALRFPHVQAGSAW